MKYQPGQVATFKRTFSQNDFDRFAALSGDDNPIHVDPEFSARTKFGRTVAHGMLLYSTICRVLGTQLPGPGAWQVAQELMFPSPTYAGEEITVQVEISRFAGEDSSPPSGPLLKQETAHPLIELKTTLTRPGGEESCRGWALARAAGSPPFTHTLAPQSFETKGAGTETLKGLAVGQRASSTRTFTRSDLVEYSSLTGDTNPLYTDYDYAKMTGLPAPLLPGGLLGGLFSYLFGTKLPGRGTNWLKQKLAFPAPAHPDEEITAWVEIISLRPKKDLVNLRTFCTNSMGQVVCDGEALVLVSDLK